MLITSQLTAQTVCAYHTGNEVYIITYAQTITATLKPNPSDGNIVITIGDIKEGDYYTVSIFDPYRLLSFNVLDKETPLDCTGLAPGVYNYIIRNHEKIVKKGKFVIE